MTKREMRRFIRHLVRVMREYDCHRKMRHAIIAALESYDWWEDE
jgi:hypothetical protein